MSELWTIEQLPDQVAGLLSENYDGQSNGRVRELPNRRTIRWYTTIGLVDRPAATRGRTVLYGRRHLLQIVAVKRLQSNGSSLAEIQQLLVGATDARLAELAGVAPIDAVRPQIEVHAPQPFWKGHTHDRPLVPPPGIRDGEDGSGETVTKLIHGIRLTDSVTVLLDAAGRAPNASDIAAVEAAAVPLLDVLSRLGLTPATSAASGSGSTSDSGSDSDSGIPIAVAIEPPEGTGPGAQERALTDQRSEPRPGGHHQ